MGGEPVAEGVFGGVEGPAAVGIGVISDDDVGVDEQVQRPNPSASMSSSSAARRPLVDRPKLAKVSWRRAGNSLARTSPASAFGRDPAFGGRVGDTLGDVVGDLDGELGHGSSSVASDDRR